MFTSLTTCVFFLIVPLITSFSIRRNSVVLAQRATCCMLPKPNINDSKSNEGRRFFTELIENNASYRNVNETSVCSLMHFLLQEAILNRRPIQFSRGMFVIYDSTKRLWSRFMGAKDAQEQGSEAHRTGYFNRLKHFVSDKWKSSSRNKKSNASTSRPFIYVRGDESSHFKERDSSSKTRKNDYPAYGMDVKGNCMPNGFGHILFGRLKDLFDDPKDAYYGDRIYFKPEKYGIQTSEDYLGHSISYTKHVSRNTLCKSKSFKKKSFCSKEAAFRENTNKTLINRWNDVLRTISSLSDSERQMMRQSARREGIHEIYRQSEKFMKDYVQVRDFRQTLMDTYGQDIRSRKGDEIIFTTEQLLRSNPACETASRDSRIQQCSIQRSS